MCSTPYGNAVKNFWENGCAVIENFLTEDEVNAAKSEMEKIVQEMKVEDHPVCLFETEEKHVKDEYFLNSSDKIRFFYEEGAVNQQGQLVVDKNRAFNKVGHALHVLNPVFKRITFSDKVKSLLKEVGYRAPAVVQSMYIFKEAGLGASVIPHFDATFLYVEPIENLIGLWFPIDDATAENGCLWYIPGSHKTHQGTYRFVRTHKQTDPLLEFTGEKPLMDETKFVPMPVSKGSCVLIHGLVFHKSEANKGSSSNYVTPVDKTTPKSTKPRHTYTFHVVETVDTKWSPDNWLQEIESYKFPKLYTTESCACP